MEEEEEGAPLLVLASSSVFAIWHGYLWVTIHGDVIWKRSIFHHSSRDRVSTSKGRRPQDDTQMSMVGRSIGIPPETISFDLWRGPPRRTP